ncbi:MAG: hypothetical protein AB7H66_13575 [Hyphomonadaceae bacterium]
MSAADRYNDSVTEGDCFAPPTHSAGESDFCSRDGAHALKAKIEAYWRERGHNVIVALHNVGFHPAIRAARFDVRSDMINGMPRSAVSTARRTAAPTEVFIDDLADDDLVFE